MASNNIGIKVNLQALNGAFLKNLTGRTQTKRCLIIPVDDNPAMFIGEKGTYLNLVGVEVKNQQYGDTHLLKGDVPKEVYEQWTDEQRQAQPILGNVRPIGPKQQTVTGSVDMNAPEGQQQDDLPF